MKPRLGQVQLLVGVLWGALAFVLPTTVAHAATGADDTAQSTSQHRKSKKATTKKTHSKKTNVKGAVVKPLGPTDPAWGETSQQRVERLTRECRGKPNGGACEGFSGS